MNFSQRLFNQGVVKSDSLLRKKGKQIYNFDILTGFILPLTSELLLRIFGMNTPEYTLITISIALFFVPHYYLMRKGYFELSACLVQVFAFFLIAYCTFFLNALMVSLFLLPLGLNPFIYFPEKKRISAAVFLFFTFSTIVFMSYEVWVYDVDNINKGSLILYRINTSLFCLLFIHKIISLISLYWLTLREHRESQLALIKSESRYRSFFEKVKIGIATKSDGKIVDANPAFLDLLGYSKEEMIGIEPKSWIHPEDFEKSEREVSLKKVNPALSQEITQRIYTKDRRLLKVLVTIAPLEEGNIEEDRQEIITVMDLTPIKKAEEALQETEGRYKSLFENAFDGIGIFDMKKSKMTDCNQKLADIYGVTKDDIFKGFPGQYMTEMQPCGSNSIAFIQHQGERVLENGIAQYEVDCVKGDCSPIHVDVTSFSLPKPNNHLTVSIFRDITEKKKQEATIKKNILELNQKNEDLEKYIESNLQLENFAYIASHDLKAPIRTIGSFSKLLKRKASSKLDETELEFLDFINKGAENMSRLVEDLLTYSKANTENNQLDLLNLPNLLEMIQHELGVSIAESKATITCKNIPKTIYADNTKIRQLFQNLIANALKFKKADVNPLIEITGKEDEKFWYFSVRDNGIGIKEEFHEKIFMLFRKLHGANEFEGSGIGLSLCKKIVEQHDGTISIDSEFGEYTQFDFGIKKSTEALS